MKKPHLLKRTLLLLALIVGCVSYGWAAEGDEITSIANIIDGQSYYIKGVRSEKTYYLAFTDATGSQSGTESSTTSGAQLITFHLVSSGVYTLETTSGRYIAPGTSNGKINVSADAINVTATNQDSKIRLSITSGTTTWSIQKNKTAANFGGYKNTQADITLIEGPSAKTLSSIAVTTNPKTAYKIGETLDLTGIVVTGTFDDSSTEDVTSKCSFDPVDGAVLGTAGNQNVAISYNDKNCNLPITVASVTALEVKTAPTKVKYRIGDNLDLTDLVLTATYSDEGTKDITTGFTASPTNGSALNTSGNVDVTLSYYGQSCTQRVTVGNLSSISYNSTGVGAFANTTYTEKDTFNPEGLVVTAHFDNDLDVVVASGYTLSPDTETELKTTDKNVTISYTWNEVEKTVNIPITVNAGTKYTVSFDAGNGTYTGGDKTETEYQGGVVMPTPTGIPDGWSFYGWAASKQTSETNEAPSVTAAGATYYPTANVTLYAVYSLVEGGEKTITATDMSGANSSATTLKTGHPITYKVSNGAYSNPMRWYSGGILTMAGATMSKIQFTMNGSYSASDITLNAGDGTYSKGTWTGESSEVKFRATAQVRIDEIKVTYTSSSTVYTSLPAPKAELSYAETEYDAALGRSFTKPTLTNTNGVTVTYESEDEDVATVDEETGDVTIVGIGTTTITASFAGNASYRKNSASYTLNVIYGNIAQIKELTSTSTPVNFNALLQDAVVTYVNDDYAYLQDASAAVMVNFEDHGLTAGDKINGKVTGTVKANYAIDVFTAFDKSAATVTDDGDIPAAETEKTLAQIKAAGTDYDGKLVTISGAKVTTALTDVANGDITDDDGTTTFKLVCPYTGINVAKDAEGNFTGFVSIYVSGVNTTYRLNIYDQSQIVLTKNAPTAQTLSFEGGNEAFDEVTSALSAFKGKSVEGAHTAVTYSKVDESSIIGDFNTETGALTLNGACGTATITATAAAGDVVEAGVTTPYLEASESYTITVSPRYMVTFSVNGVETVLRQETSGAAIAVPTPAACGDYTFVGWSTSTVAPTDDEPLTMTDLGANVTPANNNGKYYAVYAKQTIVPDVEQTSTFTFKGSAVSSPYENNEATWTFTSVTFANQNYGLLSQSITLTPSANVTSVKEITIKKSNTWGQSVTLTMTDASSNQIFQIKDGNFTSSLYTKDITSNQSSSYTFTSSGNAWIEYITLTYLAPALAYADYRTSLPTVEVTITDAQYATFCYARELNVEGTGVTAYTASANGEGEAVTLTKISDNIIPANTGVILFAESAGNYEINVSETGKEAIAGNELVGVTIRTQIPETSADKYNYIFSKKNEVIGFYRASGAYLLPNRAYLSTSTKAAAAREFMAIMFDEGETSLREVRGLKAEVRGEFFNLNGQRVATPVKGNIYIVNGKKVMFK